MHGRGVALKLDRARVRGLYEAVPQTLQPLDPGADLLPADELGSDVGDPPHTRRYREIHALFSKAYPPRT